MKALLSHGTPPCLKINQRFMNPGFPVNRVCLSWVPFLVGFKGKPKPKPHILWVLHERNTPKRLLKDTKNKGKQEPPLREDHSKSPPFNLNSVNSISSAACVMKDGNQPSRGPCCGSEFWKGMTPKPSLGFRPPLQGFQTWAHICSTHAHNQVCLTRLPIENTPKDNIAREWESDAQKLVDVLTFRFRTTIQSGQH